MYYKPFIVLFCGRTGVMSMQRKESSTPIRGGRAVFDKNLGPLWQVKKANHTFFPNTINCYDESNI